MASWLPLWGPASRSETNAPSLSGRLPSLEVAAVLMGDNHGPLMCPLEPPPKPRSGAVLGAISMPVAVDPVRLETAVVSLSARGYRAVPATLAEYALNQFSILDFFDMSLVDAFNLPMVIQPTVTSSTGKCRRISCTADINDQCPNELRSPGGCQSACTAFKSDQYCCTGSAANNCDPTNYSRFLKDRCPDAYSYPKDDSSSTFTCPSRTNHRVVFCP
ncbi:hypothetical protein AMTRI_Chr02g212740 [Amborella trichopoda]